MTPRLPDIGGGAGTASAGHPGFETMLRRQKVLADFGEFALRSDNLQQVLTEACRLVGEAAGTKGAKILEIEPGGETLLVRAGIGWGPEVVGQVRLRMSERSSESFSIRLGQPVITRDLRTETRFDLPDFMKEAGVVALANVPIYLPGGAAYGLLQIDAAEPRDFGVEDTAFLRTYAAVLGPVIDRLHQVSALHASRERFRHIVDSARDYAIFVTDEQACITDWFPGAEAVFGWSAAEAIGRSAAMLFTPEDRVARAMETEFRIARERGVALNVRPHLRKDGSRVFIDGCNRSLHRSDGTLCGFFKIGQDVTERRIIEAQLCESEKRQRALIEAMPQLVWRAADGGAWRWAGPQWCAHTGLTPKRSEGMGWLAALHPEDRRMTQDGWSSAPATGLFQADHRIRHAASGRYTWFQTRAMPVRDRDGGITEWIGTSTDIEDQVQAREVLRRSQEELEELVAARTAELMAAEESLHHAQKMESLGQLTSGIAHDFNNMLQGVTGGLEMARRRIAVDQAGQAGRYLDAAQDAVTRAAGLTRRLLAFARRQQLEQRAVKADLLVAGLADLVRRTVGPGIAVELRLRDGVGAVLCDANELESALLNLCINARDAMPRGGRLEIATDVVELAPGETWGGEDRPGSYVQIAVTDTGTGMTPAVLRQVFDPFFTTKPAGEGTGLGLSQVRSFVRQSGGMTRIDSEPGQGSTVRLLLPLHEPADAQEGAPPPPPRAAARARVLLVDDEDGTRGPVADRLRDLGYVVMEARDGQQALRLLISGRPGVLVTDVGLPNGMDGRQVAAAAQDRMPGLPVLFMTGYAEPALPPGAEVVGKPFDLDTLARRVEALLDAADGRPAG